MNLINLLIIDDRPMVIEGIKSALVSQKVLNKSFNFYKANYYEEAIKLISNFKKDGVLLDVIFADVDVKSCESEKSPTEDKKVLELKHKSRNSKIVTLMRSKDNYRIYKILKSIKPDGFLLETELNTSCLIDLIKSVLTESIYYSRSIFNILNKNQTNSLVLDDIDREILYLLSKGVKTKNLTKHIARSLSALEKRKQRIKDLLVMDNCSDEVLIEKAFLQELV